ncbi:MAG TPA: fused MFS/spermidine synthase [Longimicrobiaceae bacterium]|nr:fused MFS/spermidine synthase [Longimicrobiaceae bacterium]
MSTPTPETSLEALPPAATAGTLAVPKPGARLLVAAYAAAIFAGAFLLFLVQPMFGKMVLPLLGGSPAVWNTCMLFFQAALLGGYLYAHLTTRWLGVRRQAALHLALVLAAGLALPLSVGSAAPPGGGAPIPWLLALLLGTVGLPFLVLAATSPMLQRWFAESGSPAARNPYWLYAASNLGSLLALLSYPFLLEPRLRLAEQSWVWAAGYAGLVLLLAACAFLVRHAPSTGTAARARAGAPDAAPVSLRDRATWVALAFLPSSLLLGVTTYLTTDLASAPLLWVLPLALYLLTFTLVFAERPPLRHEWMVRVQPALLVAVIYLLLGSSLNRPAVAVPIHLAAFFVTAMVCHGELARRRPAPRHLTEFYLWLSVGGVLGGVFNVLVAPAVFDHTWEYPLVLVLAVLARPWPEGRRPLSEHATTALRAAGFAVALYLLLGRDPEALSAPVFVAMAAVFVALLGLVLGRAPLWLALCLGSVYALRAAEDFRAAETLHADRSFFGHYRVTAQAGRERFHVLTHGSTLHGAQSKAPERRRDPLTYYVRSGPLGDVFATQGLSTRPQRVAVVGLGVGTTAAYAAEGEAWTFFEIDPGIERIARDPRLFTYLADSPAETRVVLGDARLSLARESREGAPRYDLIVLDAFTSDAIPTHLLTREALEVYLDRLEPGGRLAVHVSNRYLDLESVVAAAVRDLGLAARVGAWGLPPNTPYENASTWVLAAREEEALGMLADDKRWRTARLKPGVGAWTDDHSSILDVFTW